MTQLSFEIKKNLWQTVDNKKTKDRDKVKALKPVVDITVESLEFIPILEIMLSIERLNDDLKEREK